MMEYWQRLAIYVAQVIVTFTILLWLLTPAKAGERDSLYWYSQTVTVLDGITTDRAIRTGRGVESEATLLGMAAGEKPSTAQIAAWTGLRLLLGEYALTWRPVYRDTYMWAVSISGTGIVMSNWKIAIGE